MATGMFKPILNNKLLIRSLILETGQQRRGGRLEERLRGAQYITSSRISYGRPLLMRHQTHEHSGRLLQYRHRRP